MSISFLIEILMKVVGGLGIFLLGMKYMSDGIQAVAGDRMRRLIAAVTNNRLMACGVGTMVTCLVQSSSVTTVMVVGLVNSGFMTLVQAIGVIMGANIGTTITGWILVLKIGKYGLPLLGIMALVYLFTRKERMRYLAMTFMGIGMVFFGLELMSGGFKPLRGMPEFVSWFHRFHADSYFDVLKCAAMGCILTMIVQSSSATLGITIGLAEAGIIPFPTAAALVLGENIGTTITALLASIGASRNARRAAVFHSLFNVIGVMWITAIFAFYLTLVLKVVGADPNAMVLVGGEETYPAMRRAIALTHSGFNVMNTLLFLPLVPLMARIVSRLIPEREVEEEPHLTSLDVRILSTPAIAIQQSHDELKKMGVKVAKMLAALRTIMTSDVPQDDLVTQVFHGEEVLDVMQKEITEFLDYVLSGNLPHDVIEESHNQLRMADEYESISDYVANILKLHLKREKASLKFSEREAAGILKLHDTAVSYVNMVNEGVRQQKVEVLSKARSQGQALTFMVKEMRAEHVSNAGTEGVSPLASLIFTDMLNAYRRVKDHALNIAEVLAGEK